MTSRNTVGADTAPQLVVKIIGSKLIRYYAEEPEKEKTANDIVSPENIESKAIKSSPDKEGLATPSKTTSDGGETSPWPVLMQVPERNCVTAPPGYPSLYGINHKNMPTLRSAPRVALRQRSNEHGVHSALMGKEKTKGTIGQKEEKDMDHLFTMVSEELKDWRKEALKNIEIQLQDLDSSHSRTVDRFHLTQVFLRNEIPLKLPTMHLLLHTFSKPTCPEEVYYRELFSLIADAVLNEEQQEKNESEFGNDQWLIRSEAVSVSESTQSKHPADSGLPSDTEVWLQRFQKMEEAMRMCDAQSTGLVDKEKARRLIQNYNLIFDLNLSPQKIDEAIRGSPSESRVNLDSLFQILKEL